MELERLWNVPVRIEDVPEGGLALHLSADDATRERVAEFAGLLKLRRFEADFLVSRRGRGLRVTGEVTAVVGQTCVITLDLVENAVDEAVDLLFVPSVAEEFAEDELPRDAANDRPEPLLNGTIDLGAVATEFLVLGIDPYPRRPGAVFAPPVAPTAEDGPFAALAGIRAKRTEPSR